MFSLDHLHRLRDAELARVAALLPAHTRVLELGAGSGYQAKRLAECGFRVTAIDVAASNYAADRVYPVIDYDGHTIPLADGSVDIVFSSNVLEHVRDLDRLMREITRVLAPGGWALHILPSPAWRLWTFIAGWIEAGPVILIQAARLPASATHGWTGLSRWGGTSLRAIAGRILPVRHGERGTGIGELWRFSRRWWRREFARNGYEVIGEAPMGLFYTGFMVLGPRLSLPARARLGRVLGSACRLYRVRPRTAS